MAANNGTLPGNIKDDKYISAFTCAFYGACFGIALFRHLALSGLIGFSYKGNPLGIFSPAHMQNYPKQQDSFWCVMGLAIPLATASLAMLIKRNIGGKLNLSGPLSWMVSLGVFLLTSPVVLVRRQYGWIFILVHLGFLAILPFIVSRFIKLDTGDALQGADHGNGQTESPTFKSGSRAAPFGALKILMPALALFLLVWNPSYKLGMVEMADEGGHLAWIESMSHGRWPGAETATKYGPLLECTIYLTMKAGGMTIASFRWAATSAQFLASVIVLLVAMMIVKNRWYLWVCVFILVLFNLPFLRGHGGFFSIRPAFPMTVLLCLGLRRFPKTSYFLAGFMAALSLGMAVEFGAAIVLTLPAALIGDLWAVGRLNLIEIRRRAILMAVGMAPVIVPFILAYWMRGAFGDIIGHLFQYMRIFNAGYGNLPFPKFPWMFITNPFSLFRGVNIQMYLPPLIYLVTAVELAARGVAGRWNAKAAIRGSLLVYGILSFRSVLGRSDIYHLNYASLPAAILFTWILEQAVSLTIHQLKSVKLRYSIFFPASWTLLIIVTLLYLSIPRFAVEIGRMKAVFPGWREKSAVLKWAEDGNAILNLQRAGGIWAPREQVAEITEITNFLLQNTSPDTRLFIMANSGVYYFLADRQSPIWFDFGGDAVTKELRNEARDMLLKIRPPVLLFTNDYIDFPISVEHREEFETLKQNYRIEKRFPHAFFLLPKQ